MSPPSRRRKEKKKLEVSPRASPGTARQDIPESFVGSPPPSDAQKRCRGQRDSSTEEAGAKRACDKTYSTTGSYKAAKSLPVPLKPARDPKEYRVIELQNGARVVLISELKETKGKQVSLPYISDSRNVYVGQSSGKSREKSNTKRYQVQEVCSNCIKQPWVWGFEDFGISGDNDFLDASDVSKGPYSGTLPQFPLNAPTGGGDNQMVSCAVTVGSGYLDEPAKYGGLAHFCEHMVFLGSEEHPEENELMSIVRLHGGQLNACTMPESTHFYYSIVNSPANDLLDRSLDVFSHFFTKPTFTMQSIKREINALDHEFRMKRPNDMVCRLEILKHGVKDGHPMKNFFWGDKTTLGGNGSSNHYEDLRKHLVDFHKGHYVGSNITIALQASMTLDELEAIALKHFNKIQSGSSPGKNVADALEYPFETPEFNRRYAVKPVGALDTLYLTWALPKTAWDNYRTKPLNYLSSMISSDVKGGLSDYLQEEQFIMGLQCGLQLMSRTKYGVLFVIKLWLTETGVEHQDDVIKSVFGYMDSLRQKGVASSIYKRMQEIRDANLINYGNYRPQLSNAKKLSHCLQLYPSQDIIFGDTKFFQFDRQSIQEVLKDLVPQNLNVMLFSHGFGKQEFPHCESNTKCFFHYEDFSPKVVNSWCTKLKAMNLTVPIKVNPYLTTDFSHLNHQGSQPTFLNIAESEKLRVSFIPVGLPFPFGYYHVIIKSQDRKCTGKSKAMLQLWTRMLQSELREPIGLAEEAGIMSHIQPGPDGKVHVLVYGYDKMAGKLLKDILQIVGKTHCLEDEDLFEVSREYLLKVSHYMLLYPSYLAHNLLHRTWKWGENSMLDIHAALVDMTFTEFNSICNEYLNEMQITMVALGNPKVEEVQSLADNLCRINYKPLSPSSAAYPDKRRMVNLPRVPVTWRVDSLNKTGSTSTLISYYQFSQATLKEYFLGFILLRMMAQPMFSELRTQRSLGYAIESGMVYEGGVLGAIFGVTSDADKFNMEELNKEQDNFLAKFYRENLENMSQSEFQQYVAKISGMSLDSFTVSDLREFYLAYIMPGPEATRKKLSIQVTGHSTNAAKGQGDNGGGEGQNCQREYDKKLIINPHKPVNSMLGNEGYYIQDVDLFHTVCALYPAV